MCAQWKKDHNPALPLAKLDAEKKINSNGLVEYPFDSFDDCLELLCSAVKFSSDLLEDTARGFVYQAVHLAAKANKLNQSYVLREISGKEEEYKNKPVLRFVMAGCISIKSQHSLATIQSSECAIKFGLNVPKAILKQEVRYPRIFLQAESREFPREYLRFAISTLGKSDSEAGWQALDTLDYYRALWNLRLNSQSPWRMSSGPIDPVNKIVLGPLQTLFSPDATLIEDKWWNDRGYRRPQKVFDVTDLWKDLRKYDTWARTKINASPCKDTIVDGLLRYVRALDGRDYEAVFLKLWSVLEHFTQSTTEDKKVTIRRAAFVWKDYEFNKEILLHLKEIRNNLVHLDRFGVRGEAVVYQLKRYVEAMLGFYIASGGKFKSKEEIIRFLELDPIRETLSERSRLIKRGIKFRSS